MSDYEYQSQIGQDRHYIEQVIRGRRNGRFLDVGAHDGKTTSNTYVLEKELGWTGVCVESNPELIPALTENRPKSQVVEATVWNIRTKVKFETPASGDTLLSRVKGQPVNADYFREEFEAGTSDRVVRTKRIRDILGPGFHRFDYFSLDVEGAELKALKGIDWSRTRFGYIALEHGNREGYLNEIIAYLASVRYRVTRINAFDVDFRPYAHA